MRIALCGESRSGKDTVGELIGYARFAFGDYMKREYYKANPHMVGKPKDREHMIEWSQPQVEKDDHIWIRPLEEDISTMYNPYHNIVITDLRQPHEEKWCRDNGFHIVRVHAHVLRRDLRARNLGEKLGKDLPYEVKADFHIYNDGSLEDLQSRVDNLLDCLNDIEAKRRRL
ncbi:AAA family ATPase [Bacillus cereus]|uniref:deoxynucleotide monophosphate kinase family protein n=1 Tax=Bacillus cereus TaxID=1396 RepID=UPI0013D7BE9D|nr:AAA family ATPase [Bacillus cereus]